MKVKELRCGIYSIRNTTTGDEYIGASAHLVRRLGTHRTQLRRGTHPNPRLQLSWDEHGESAFSFDVIEECPIGVLQRRELVTIAKRSPKFNSSRVRSGSFPDSIRKLRMVTIDDKLAAIALRVGKSKLPPITSLSRIIDEALVEWTVKHGPKGKGAK